MTLESKIKMAEVKSFGGLSGMASDLTHGFFNLSPDAIIISELKSGAILEVNKSFESLYGSSAESVKGKTVFQLELFKAKEGRGKFINNILDNGKVDDFDAGFKTVEGKYVPVSIAGSITKFHKIDVLITVVRNISERSEHAEYIASENETLTLRMAGADFERELLENAASESVALLDQVAITNDDLEILNKQKDKFFSIIAHDLKSPFSAILGFSSMLRDNADTLDKKSVSEYSGYLHQAAENCHTILNDLLDWAMAQMGRLTYEPSEFLISDATSGLDDVYSPLAKAKGVKMIWDLPKDLKSISDKKMVETVLRNLVNNSIKFTNDGGTITTKAEPYDKGIKFSISDTGIGMTQEQIDGLFDLAGGASTHGTSGEVGSGLGLSLCQEFVEVHGGVIKVSSEISKGTCFTFTIPDQ